MKLHEYTEGIEQGKEQRAARLKKGNENPVDLERGPRERVSDKLGKKSGVSASMIERAARKATQAGNLKKGEAIPDVLDRGYRDTNLFHPV